MSLALSSPDQDFGDDDVTADPRAVSVRLDALSLGVSPRKSGIRPEHVRSLAQLEGHWPPLLVNRADRTVIDGAHRFHAARMLGHTSVWCVFFDGDRDEAFVEAVRRNTRHGLPLTLRDREEAAARLLGVHHDWSNRRVAELCALAHGTVGKIREQVCSAGKTEQLIKRVGRDGRIRPVDSTETRKTIAAALASAPEATSRQIASQVGVSPTTVASVRSKMRQSQPGLETRAHPSNGRPSGSGVHLEPVDALRVLSSVPDTEQPWRSDLSLISTPEQKDFLSWFETTSIGDEWVVHVETPPLSRIYELADEARRRSMYWGKFAEAIESRSGSRSRAH